jgi:RimJ/RimL family protein N-acetyltransferase
MNHVLETERLTLREMTIDDLDFLHSMLSHPEVMRYYPKCYSRTESEEWLNNQLNRYEKDGHGLWLVSDKDSGKPAGQVGLVMQLVNGAQQPEIGYMIHHEFWRRGLASEAAAGVREYAFEVLNKPRVISLIRPENLPSQGVAVKIGMQPEGRALHHEIEHIVFALARSSEGAKPE